MLKTACNIRKSSLFNCILYDPPKTAIVSAKTNIHTAKSKNSHKKSHFHIRKWDFRILMIYFAADSNIFKVNFPFACVVVQVPPYFSAAFFILEIPKPCRNLSAFVV